MCVGDWRLGRLMSIQSTNWASSGSVNLTYLPNMQRVGILLGCVEGDVNAANIVKISIDDIVHNALCATNNNQFYSLATHGLLVTRKFTITTVGIGTSGSVIEFFLPEDYLAACTDSFKSEYRQWLGSN